MGWQVKRMKQKLLCLTKQEILASSTTKAHISKAISHKKKREIINGIPVFLHFIIDTPVFFRLSMVPPAFNANYNRDINDDFVVIYPFILKFS